MLGKVPTRVELFTYMDSDVYEYCIGKSKENIFKDYLGFLNSNDDLNKNQQIIYGGIAREFIKNIENTAMTKVYKMPVLASFCYIDDDNVDAMNTKNIKEQAYKEHNNYIKMELSEADVIKGWKKFFDNGTNWKDFGDAITREEYMQISDKKHLSKIKQMPVKYVGLCTLLRIRQKTDFFPFNQSPKRRGEFACYHTIVHCLCRHSHKANARQKQGNYKQRQSVQHTHTYFLDC